MTPEDYGIFIGGSLSPGDPIHHGLGLHADIMTRIAQKFSKEDTLKIGRMIDTLIGSVLVQHLNSAVLHPDMVLEAEGLLRNLTVEKLRSLK